MINALLKALLTTGLIFVGLAVFSQSYILGGDTLVTTCTGVFFDNGGQHGNYLPNTNSQVTFCPDSENKNIRISLPALFIEEGDLLSFYDGATTSAPMLACSDDVLYGLGFTVQGSLANLSGCVTAVFESDSLNNGPGWQGTISCIKDCQPILPEILLSKPTPSPGGSIDLCVGDTITLKGGAQYPQNGAAYSQSDEMTQFEWRFGDGGHASGDSVRYAYPSSGGFFIQLTATDTNGCQNTSLLHQLVHVAEPPSFTIIEDTSSFCPGDTITLLGGVGSSPENNEIVSAYSDSLSFLSSYGQSQSLFLPDGNGISYIAIADVNSFPPGSTVINGNEMEGICFELEHSYAGDLDIEIICPSGQSVHLLDYGNASVGSTNFGEPWATGGVDSQSMDSTQGVPYSYCFSMIDNNFGTLDSEAGNHLYTYTTVPNAEGTTHTYSDSYFPSGTYLPHDSLTGLEGCPLNGEWTIRVQDNLSQDNGWLHLWSINFFSNTVPAFSAPVNHTQWLQGEGVIYSDSETLMAIADTVDQMRFVFEATNVFNCRSKQEIDIPIWDLDDAPCEEIVSTAKEEVQIITPPEITIFPNPAQQELTVAFSTPTKEPLQISLINLQGRQLKLLSIPTGQRLQRIDLSGIAAGYYLVQTSNPAGVYHTQPLIILP